MSLVNGVIKAIQVSPVSVFCPILSQLRDATNCIKFISYNRIKENELCRPLEIY